jgi:hypothetical protein
MGGTDHHAAARDAGAFLDLGTRRVGDPAGDADDVQHHERCAFTAGIEDHGFAEQRVEHTIGAAFVIIAGHADAERRSDVHAGHADAKVGRPDGQAGQPSQHQEWQ